MRLPKCACITVFILVLMCAIVMDTHAQQQVSSAGEQVSTNQDSKQQENASSQQPNKGNHNGPDMPNMQVPGAQHSAMNISEPETFVEEIEQHATSGTSAEPTSTPIPMLMTMKGNWMLMFHGVGFLNVQQQTGPRGADKVFSTNWLMPMAQRRLGPGTFTARTMLSFEPATITGRYFPELFQQGETAFGKPIVDGQHPHNFFMELAVLYDLYLGEQSLLSFYVAPVGDPAMGPTAYPHRASASEDPLAALGHHLEDSTHISDDVITMGLTHKILRLEASGFHGREPDENRWTIEAGAIDSWSTRLTVQPGQNWSGQYSFAHLTSLEALQPNDDVQRMTASVMYNRPLEHGNWQVPWFGGAIECCKPDWSGMAIWRSPRFNSHNETTCGDELRMSIVRANCC